MNTLSRNLFVLLLFITRTVSVNAQYDEVNFRATAARLVPANGSDNSSFILNKALVFLPNGSNELQVAVNIPYSIVANTNVEDSDVLNPGYQFRLKVTINLNEMQGELTSAKTYTVRGMLTLNGITNPVQVSYIPVVSGPDENGNFSVFLTARFSLADFNLEVPDVRKEFIICLNNARVNRV
ncbi:MAG: hypothetical protein NTW29_12495 [Bacteroidetes bacterium]|nr:hypothetical protein [Bacteroidota bacterium]